jgi:solute carrier family 25 aspartate/glutamate transporter 12/13
MAYNACHASLLAYLGLSRTADLPFAWEALAGAAAGAAQTIIACPLEAAKIPLQMTDAAGAAAGGKRRQTSLWSVLKDLGLSGLFRGADVCLARDVIAGAIFFSCFAAAKHAVVGSGQLSSGEAVQAAFLTKLVAGAIAGVPSALLTTPLDVVKTRLQAQPGDTVAADEVDGEEGDEGGREAPSEAPQVGYTSTWECLVRTVTTDGWSALACGAGERVARLSPQLGITLALYELLDPVR